MWNKHPLSLPHICHTTYYQQSYTGNVEHLRRLAQVLYVCVIDSCSADKKWVQILKIIIIALEALKYVRINHGVQRVFFEIIINVLVSSFWFILIPILWVYDHSTDFTLTARGRNLDVRRQTLTFNPLTAKLLNLNFHPLEVVSRWRDPQLKVSENYSDMTEWRSTVFKSCWLMSHVIFTMFKRWYLMC